MQICKKIREIRGNESQSSFAERFGITARTLQNYEYGNTSPSIDFIQKISQEYDIAPEYFFDYGEKSFRNSSAIVPQYSSSIQKKSSSISKNNITHTNSSAQTLNQDDFYFIPKLNITASAGGGNELEGLECYESGQTLAIDKAFFKAIPSHNIKAIRVDGYSMIPLLFPDSWVIFEEGNEFKGDGLYIINYANQLMVKLLQLNPITNILEIISTNKNYKSYEVSLSESQELCLIRGKVLRSII